MHTIENDHLRVAIKSQGAELDSLFHKKHQMEYLWSGDPAFWGKKSPVLFPIVGTLKNNVFSHKGKSYILPRHGFARDRKFRVLHQNASQIEFRLRSDEESMKVYPFVFDFRILYALEGENLHVRYRILNPSGEALYASVGAHPAFKVPLEPGLNYEDYHLEFSNLENAGRYPISPEGLIETASEPLFHNATRLPLSKELFQRDALVFKELQSTQISLKSDQSPRGLRMTFEGFPFFGIWAAPNANFVCLEPWCGIADRTDSTGVLTEKEGINEISAGGTWERTWSVELL